MATFELPVESTPVFITVTVQSGDETRILENNVRAGVFTKSKECLKSIVDTALIRNYVLFLDKFVKFIPCNFTLQS